MATTATGCMLGDLLAAEQLGLSLFAEQPAARSRLVRGARLVWGNDLDAIADDLVLVPVAPQQAHELMRTLVSPGWSGGSRIVALPDTTGEAARLRCTAHGHVILTLPAAADPAELIAAIAHASAQAEQALTQRLTSLQRALAQVLAAPVPLEALTVRVAQVCNAVVTLVSDAGSSEYATGPLPLSLLMPEVSGMEGDSRQFSVSGWHGLAVRLSAASSGRDAPAWLLAASTRDTFPDPYSTAAVFIAASLAETSLQIDLAAVRQERAVRSAVLEQALALRAERHDAELAGRIASLGVSFDQEARMIVIESARAFEPSRDQVLLERLYEQLQRALNEDDTGHLLVLRENALVGLVQASPGSLRRSLVKAAGTPRDLMLGIGRDAADVGHVVDSYHDAQLAIRVLRRGKDPRLSMCYEDFDFATRLFSDVGLEKMSEWAGDLLRPLEDKQTMLITLSTYFEHSQNIMETAEALAVHHNSLRYRLAKIESTLQLSLRDPSAVSSLFLALTTLAMTEAADGSPRPLAPGRRAAGTGDAKGVHAAGAVFNESPQRLSPHFGAAVGPER
ncbi:PucR family transcriptional regulator [Streptomyces sp. GMR22]|uniref:PucR family transcriptional regulator n=1 Tax=Streptomyces sp. GMR22 TaxID=2759524 RepID=UPI0015FA60D4|nr:helix-turn-helix domain-containing protein [Streptomyces sp. GMR22]MBA6440767.1 helix-turn-helix domain-containing protein [Streptomyces sp. GMR22]